MKILKTSGELTTTEKYYLTMSPEVKKLSDMVGAVLSVEKWAFYSDVNAKDEEVEILSFMTDEGEVYATNSATFATEFFRMIDLFADNGEEVTAIKVVGGVSKNGRDFITCGLGVLD